MKKWKVKYDEYKVKALREHILEECERQSFTRHEFSRLLYLLEKSDSDRGSIFRSKVFKSFFKPFFVGIAEFAYSTATISKFIKQSGVKFGGIVLFGLIDTPSFDDNAGTIHSEVILKFLDFSHQIHPLS